MKKQAFLIFLTLLSLAFSHQSSLAQGESTTAITARDIRERLSVLASDSLEGRRSGSPGAEKAARYISQEFRRIGLTPIDSEKSFLQHFTFKEHLDSVHSELISTANVIGLLKSNDPHYRGEYIIVGAHYDHLGYGGKYALDTVHAIHYGADDNASGATGVLELAEYFAAHRSLLKRSIVFMSFSGEEEGLCGSSYYVNHPLVPLANTVAMINMDMIGRLAADSTLIVEGVGTSPIWTPLVKRLDSPKQFNLKLKQTGMGPSDHESFYLKNLPVLFFFTGFHTDYHRSTDTRDKINAEGEVKVLDFVRSILYVLAESPDTIPFSHPAEDTTQKASSFHVYVGGVPDYGYDGDGVRISAIMEHSPAEKAGFKAMDVIVDFGGKKIRNIYDYTDALSKYKPGDVVNVLLDRGTIQVTLPVTLGSRAAH
jgi:hypothetical protein